MKTVDELNPEEFTLPPLHQAARQRDVNKAAALIAAGADVNETDARHANGDGGNTPLWYAAQGLPPAGVAVAGLLVEAGAAVNARGEHGMTPLHMACSWGHADIAEFLHRNGASLDIEDDFGRTPPALAQADYEEGKAMPQDTWPTGFENWLHGIAAINSYFAGL